MYLLILICLINWPSVKSDERPIIQEIFVSKNLMPNQTVRLICALLSGEQPIKFEWYFNDEKLFENNNRKIKINEDSSDLIIKSTSIDDIGKYECIASHHEFGSDRKEVNVYFNVAPIWINEPQDITAQLNKELILNCSTKAYPEAKTKWIKLNKNKTRQLKDFETNLIKLNLSNDEAGYYSCISTNSIGSLKKTISIDYFGKLH